MSLDPIPLPHAGLTLLPPWPAYIVYAGKRIENRAPSVASRIGRWRGRVAIGCSKSFDAEEAQFAADEVKRQPWFRWRGPKGFKIEPWCGHIVAVADLVDVRRNATRTEAPWEVDGQSGLVLGRVWQIEPVAASGARGFYTIAVCPLCGHIGAIENPGAPLRCRRCKCETAVKEGPRPMLRVLDVWGADGECET